MGAPGKRSAEGGGLYGKLCKSGVDRAASMTGSPADAKVFGNALGNSIVGALTPRPTAAGTIRRPGEAPAYDFSGGSDGYNFATGEAPAGALGGSLANQYALRDQASATELSIEAGADAVAAAYSPSIDIGGIVNDAATMQISVAPSTAVANREVRALNAAQSSSDKIPFYLDRGSENPLSSGGIPFSTGFPSSLGSDQLARMSIGQGQLRIPNPIAAASQVLNDVFLPNASRYLSETSDTGSSFFQSLGIDSQILDAYAGFGKAATNSVIGLNNILPGQRSISTLPITQSEIGGAALFDVANVAALLEQAGTLRALTEGGFLATEAVPDLARGLSRVFPSFSASGPQGVFAQVGALNPRGISVNQNVGGSFERYVAATRMATLLDRGLAVQNFNFPTPELISSGKRFVTPDFTVFNEAGNLSFIADAKSGLSIPFDLQARAFVDVSSTSLSRTLIYHTPTGTTPIDQSLTNYALSQGVRIKQIGVP
jgi:hypothetical protein